MLSHFASLAYAGFEPSPVTPSSAFSPQVINMFSALSQDVGVQMGTVFILEITGEGFILPPSSWMSWVMTVVFGCRFMKMLILQGPGIAYLYFTKSGGNEYRNYYKDSCRTTTDSSTTP